MNYPCGIIRDLLPLFIDDVCNEESKQAVEQHLLVCEKCRNCYETMKSTCGFVQMTNDRLVDEKAVDSLKNVKITINKKIRNIVLCAVAAVCIFVFGWYLLFDAAIMNVPLDTVSVSADVYSLAELVENSVESVPSTGIFEVDVPYFGTLTLTESSMKEFDYVTAISIGAEYFLRTVETEAKDNTMYITAIKTSLLNNEVTNFQRRSLELQEINSIVFVDDNGTETVLWSR